MFIACSILSTGPSGSYTCRETLRNVGSRRNHRRNGSCKNQCTRVGGLCSKDPLKFLRSMVGSTISWNYQIEVCLLTRVLILNTGVARHVPSLYCHSHCRLPSQKHKREGTVQKFSMLTFWMPILGLGSRPRIPEYKPE